MEELLRNSYLHHLEKWSLEIRRSSCSICFMPTPLVFGPENLKDESELYIVCDNVYCFT